MVALHVPVGSRRPINKIISDINKRFPPKENGYLEIALDSREKIWNILYGMSGQKDNSNN